MEWASSRRPALLPEQRRLPLGKKGREPHVASPCCRRGPRDVGPLAGVLLPCTHPGSARHEFVRLALAVGGNDACPWRGYLSLREFKLAVIYVEDPLAFTA